MTPVCILIVGKKGVAALEIQNHLTQEGYSIAGIVPDGDSALEWIATHTAEVALIEGEPEAKALSLLLKERFRLSSIIVDDGSTPVQPQHDSGTESFFFVSKQPTTNELRTVIEAALYTRRVETELQHVTRLYSTLSQLNQAVVRTHTRQGLLQETCRIAVEYGGFQMAWVGWRHAHEPQVWVAAEHGDQHGYLSQISVYSDNRPEGQGAVGIAIREGHSVIIRSLAEDVRMAPWRETAAKSGLISMAAFPLKVGGQVLGALAVYASESDYFKQREVDLLSEIAQAVSFALDKQEEESLRKQTERQIKANEEHYRQLYHNAPVAYQSLDANGAILNVNEMWLETTGYDRDDVIGRWFGDLLTSDAMDRFREQYARLKLTGETRGVEFDVHRKDGSVVTLILNGRASYSETGVFQQTHCVLRDITQVRQAEKALNESNQFYQQIIANAKDGIFVCDTNMIVCVWNPAMERIFGVSKVEALGHHAPTALSFLCKCGLFNEMSNVFKGQTSQGLTFFFEHDSHSGWVSQTNSPLRDVSGNIGGVIGVARDITEYKRAEQNLRKSSEQIRESEERYRRLIELSPDTVLIQSEGKIVFINPAGIKLLGASHASQIIGKPILDLIHPDYRETATRRIILLTENQVTVPLVEQKFIRLDGKAIDVEVMSVAFSFNSVPAIQITARDISARKVLEARYLRDQRIETIGALASGIAHDLNNVLAPIIMTIALLRDKCEDAETLSMISAMESSAHRGAGIVQQLLTFGRGAGGQKILIQPKHLIKEIATIARETFPKTIDIVTQVQNSDWLVLGDPTQIHQVILNLCINARDAMPEGGKLTLALGFAQIEENDPHFVMGAKTGPHVVISVQDTGKGVPEELRERIFEPFFTTKDPGKGTGLGLATCANLVKRHGGFIHLISDQTKGALFQVYLPANTPVAATDTVQQPTHLPPANGELILIVDDEESIRRITRAALEKQGYRVLTANDGMEAITVFKRHQRHIRAVLMDIMMPVMGGVAAMRHLRAISPNVVLLATSGMVPKEMESELAELKPQGFLPKPFTTWELLDLIGTAIRKSS